MALQESGREPPPFEMQQEAGGITIIVLRGKHDLSTATRPPAASVGCNLVWIGPTEEPLIAY